MTSKFIVKDCPDRRQRVQQFLQRLHDEGRGTPGVSPLIGPDVPPAWYDEPLFKKGQTFAHRYLIRCVTDVFMFVCNNKRLFSICTV